MQYKFKIYGIKFIRKLFSKCVQYLELFKIMPPYSYVQMICEQSCHSYLDTSRENIRSWVIVGGYLGLEVPSILRRYPNCHVTIFECSQRYVHSLRRKFSKNPRVTVIEMAVADVVGTLDFFETNLAGSGSLLTVGELANESYGMVQAESFSVSTTTLDLEFKDCAIDVLQLDVQGAELRVLAGGVETLKNTKVVLSEVSLRPNLYNGAVVFSDLDKTLSSYGFSLALMGTDFNLTGNLMYISGSPR